MSQKSIVFRSWASYLSSGLLFSIHKIVLKLKFLSLTDDERIRSHICKMHIPNMLHVPISSVVAVILVIDYAEKASI